MISLLNKYKKVIFIITVGIFLIGVFFGLGAYVFSSNERGAVASVGGETIPADKFYIQVQRVLNNLKDTNPEVNQVMENSVKQEVLREMILEKVLYKEAERLGLNVSDFEVSAEIQNTPQFFYEKNFNPRLYVQTVYEQFKMTPNEYENWRRDSRMGNKLKQFVYSDIKVTPEEVKDYFISKNKSLKNFDKEKDKYAQELRQKEFMDSANYMLRQITNKMEIKTYLDKIEKNA